MVMESMEAMLSGAGAGPAQRERSGTPPSPASAR